MLNSLFSIPKKLLNLVESLYSLKKENICETILSCFSVLISYFRFSSKNTSSLTVLSHRVYELSYSIGDHEYIIPLHNRGKPKWVSRVFDENNTDITEKIRKYLGLNEDWHKQSYTPSFWGYKKLSFEFLDDSRKEFSEYETINLYDSTF